jgi:putative transposase
MMKLQTSYLSLPVSVKKYGYRKLYQKLRQEVTGKLLPAIIKSDNGREFRSKAIKDWCCINNLKWEFIQPGKPMQNGFCERFNGIYRNEVLDSYEFASLAEAKLITSAWMSEYNNERPHTRLGGLTPNEYERKFRENCPI